MVELGVGGLVDAREIGRGGFATVYEAHQTDFGRRVAVKIINQAATADVRRRFDRERRIMGKVAGHPNIVTPFHSGYTEPGDSPYVMMELVEGGSLQELLDRGGPLHWRRAVDFILPIARALDHARVNGVVHRDVKPANILLDDNVPKLTDFGIAAVHGSTTTSTAATFAYSPPETWSDGLDRRDHRADVYSLAATLYAVITGNSPFAIDGYDSAPALTRRIEEYPPPALPTSFAPPAVSDVVRWALAKSPADRPATAAAFADALAHAAGIEQPVAPPGIGIGSGSTARFTPGPGGWQPPFGPAAAPPGRTPSDDTTAGGPPPWLLGLVGMLGVLLLAGVGFGIVRLLEDPSADTEPVAATDQATTDGGGAADAPPGDNADTAQDDTAQPDGQDLEAGDPADPGGAPGRFEPGSLGVVRVGAGDRIQIRSLNSISGDVAFLGIPMERAVAAAIDDYGQVAGFDVDLGAGLDDGCSPDVGEEAARSIVADTQVVGVIGTACSGAAVTAAPIITDAGLVMISPSNTSPALTSDLRGTPGSDRHDGYYRTGHNDLHQAEAMAAFAIEVLGVTTAAAIHDGDVYTESLAVGFEEAFTARGGRITAVVSVDRAGSDADSALGAVGADQPGALFVPSFQPLADIIAERAPLTGGLESTALLFTDGVLVDSFLELPVSGGIHLSSPVSDWGDGRNQSTGLSADDVLSRYEAAWGEEPTVPFWANAYDATTLLLDAIQATATMDGDTLVVDRALVRNHLDAVTGYQGLTGSLSCDLFGDCGSQRVIILEHPEPTDVQTTLDRVVYSYTPS